MMVGRTAQPMNNPTNATDAIAIVISSLLDIYYGNRLTPDCYRGITALLRLCFRQVKNWKHNSFLAPGKSYF
jgi:hypothetical protein